MLFSQLLAKAAENPHFSPMGKFSCPRASTWQRRAKDCLTRPRRVPCLCHRRHRSSMTVCEAWFWHVSKVLYVYDRLKIRWSEWRDASSIIYTDWTETQRSHVTILKRPSTTPIADVLQSARGSWGRPLRKGKTVEHAGSSISLSELSQDLNSVVPIDAVRDPSRITRKKRPRAHADRHLRVSDVLTARVRLDVCVYSISCSYMQMHSYAVRRHQA